MSTQGYPISTHKEDIMGFGNVSAGYSCTFLSQILPISALESPPLLFQVGRVQYFSWEKNEESLVKHKASFKTEFSKY